MIVKTPKDKTAPIIAELKTIHARSTVLQEELSVLVKKFLDDIAKIFNGHPREVTVVTYGGTIRGTAEMHGEKALKFSKPSTFKINCVDIISIEGN